ncbi:MAG: YdcF family protein, partial [Staphylococcus equorum]|nr:YdcF family protein [Staphylococcus equorum]
PDQILMEDASTSTYENIKFTKALIQQSFKIKPKIVCVTSQFHIMRAVRFGQKLDLKLTGVGSHTPYHFFEVALIRDFLALMYQYKLLLTVYFATLFFACIFALWHIPTL